MNSSHPNRGPWSRPDSSIRIGRFRPVDFRPLSHTAAEHRQQVAALDALEPTLRAERERLAAMRNGLMGEPQALDTLDVDIADMDRDIGRLVELRASLAAAIPDLESSEATRLAELQAEAAEYRGNGDALQARVADFYTRHAAVLAEFVELLQAWKTHADARAPLSRRIVQAASSPDDGSLYLGPAAALHRNVYLPGASGKPPLFDGRRLYRQFDLPRGMVALELE